MQRRLNLLAKSLGMLLLLFVVFTSGLFIYLKNMDFNAYKPLLTQAILKATGRNMEIDGIVKLDFSLHPFLIVEGLHLANMNGGSRANMINIGRMEVQLSLMPLIDGELEVDEILLIEPEILLEVLPSDAVNWSFDIENDKPIDVHAVEDEGLPDDSMLLPQVRRILFRNAKIIYRDTAIGDDILVKLHELGMNHLKGESQFSLSGQGTVNHRELQFSGSIDDISNMLLNQPIQLLFDGNLAGIDFSFSGSMEQPLDGQGYELNTSLKSDSMRVPAEMLEIPLFRDFPLEAQLVIKDNANGFIFSKIEVKVNTSDVSGQLVLNLTGERPAIEGVLSSTYLDIKQFLPLVELKSSSASGTGENKDQIDPTAKKRLLPAQRIDISALELADIKIDLKVKRLLLPDHELVELETNINLVNGRLKLAPLVLGIAGGKVSGSVGLASAQSEPSVSLQLYVSDIQPSALLPLEKGKKALIQGAPIHAELTLTGKGRSVAEIMARADGVLLLQLGGGRIQSQALRLIGGDLLMNLANTVNPFAKKMNYNELICGVVHFRIHDGEMRTRKGIAFETDRMNITSSGTVNLKSEKVDLSFSTETREGIGLNITNMVNVVKLGGTLAEPGMVADAAKTGIVAARTVGAIASGGLSLLGESLLNRVTADSNPCETALLMLE